MYRQNVAPPKESPLRLKRPGTLDVLYPAIGLGCSPQRIAPAIETFPHYPVGGFGAFAVAPPKESPLRLKHQRSIRGFAGCVAPPKESPLRLKLVKQDAYSLCTVSRCSPQRIAPAIETNRLVIF